MIALIFSSFKITTHSIVITAGNLEKSASESSLSDAGETTSAKETARRHDEKDICSDNEDSQQYTGRKEEPIDSCEEAKQDYDNDKDLDTEKEIQKSKLQKQGNVVLRRKSKGNPLYRKSKYCLGFYLSEKVKGLI